MNGEVIYFGITLIFLLAAIQSFRIFRYLELIDYLYFSLVFVFFGLDALLIGLGYLDTIFELTCFLVYIFMIRLILSNLQESHSILESKIWIVTYSILSIFIFLSFIIENRFHIAIYFRFFFTDIIIFFIGYEIIKTYTSLKIIHKTKKTILGIRLWLSMGVIALLIGIIRGIAFSVAIIDHIVNMSQVSLNSEYITTTDLISTMGYGLYGVFMVLSIFYAPEVLIVTKSQLIRAARLYDALLELDVDQDKPFLKSSLDFLKEYLNEVSNFINPAHLQSEDQYKQKN